MGIATSTCSSNCLSYFSTQSYRLNSRCCLQILSEIRSLRGKEGWPDYVQLVFTRTVASGSGDRGWTGNEGCWTPDEIGQLHLEAIVDVQCPAYVDLSGGDSGDSQVKKKSASSPVVDATSAFIACLRTDRPDGLIPTVVCDTSGIALGLVSGSIGAERMSFKAQPSSLYRRRRLMEQHRLRAWYPASFPISSISQH